MFSCLKKKRHHQLPVLKYSIILAPQSDLPLPGPVEKTGPLSDHDCWSVTITHAYSKQTPWGEWYLAQLTSLFLKEATSALYWTILLKTSF